MPDRDKMTSEQLHHQIGYLTLKSILDTGLLLTPEIFSIHDSRYLHYDPRRWLDLIISRSHENTVTQFQMYQVRACFTLAKAPELKQKILYSSPYDGRREISSLSHFDLFGDFAIGLDPIEARNLGAIPTIYYYSDVFNSLSSSYGYGTGSTLSSELIFRLLEARKLLIGLAHIEALANSNCKHTPSIEQLKEMGQTLDGEPQSVIEAASRLNENLAKVIYPLFDTKRVPIGNIVEHLEILLSLFQVADSRIHNRPLAYFQQKEWRIIQYNKKGLDCEPLFGPKYNQYSYEKIHQLLDYLYRVDSLLEEPIFLHMFENGELAKNLWLLMSCDHLYFRDFIKQIIVPDCSFDSTQELISTFNFQSAAPQVVSHSQIMEG